MDSPPQSFENYAQWRKAVGRAFKSLRPDVEISHLDKNFLWESFTNGVAPQDFVVQTNLKFEIPGRDGLPSAWEGPQTEELEARVEPEPSGDYPCPHCRELAVTETVKEEASKARTSMQGLAGIFLIVGAILIMGGCFGLWIDVIAVVFLGASFVLMGVQACFPHAVTMVAIRTCHACGRIWRVEDASEQPAPIVSEAEVPGQVATTGLS